MPSVPSVPGVPTSARPSTGCAIVSHQAGYYFLFNLPRPRLLTFVRTPFYTVRSEPYPSWVEMPGI